MTWTYINGSAKAGASVLDTQALAPFEANNSPPPGPAAKTMSFQINQTEVTTWVIDREPFEEPNVPILYGETSAGWNSTTTTHLPFNSTIDIVFNIANDSIDTVRIPLPDWRCQGTAYLGC